MAIFGFGKKQTTPEILNLEGSQGKWSASFAGSDIRGEHSTNANGVKAMVNAAFQQILGNSDKVRAQWDEQTHTMTVRKKKFWIFHSKKRYTIGDGTVSRVRKLGFIKIRTCVKGEDAKPFHEFYRQIKSVGSSVNPVALGRQAVGLLNAKQKRKSLVAEGSDYSSAINKSDFQIKAEQLACELLNAKTYKKLPEILREACNAYTGKSQLSADDLMEFLEATLLANPNRVPDLLEKSEIFSREFQEVLKSLSEEQQKQYRMEGEALFLMHFCTMIQYTSKHEAQFLKRH